MLLSKPTLVIGGFGEVSFGVEGIRSECPSVVCVRVLHGMHRWCSPVCPIGKDMGIMYFALQE